MDKFDIIHDSGYIFVYEYCFALREKIDYQIYKINKINDNYVINFQECYEHTNRIRLRYLINLQWMEKEIVALEFDHDYLDIVMCKNNSKITIYFADYNININDLFVIKNNIVCSTTNKKLYSIDINDNYKIKLINFNNILENNVKIKNIEIINENIFILDNINNLIIFDFKYDILETDTEIIVKNYHKINNFEYGSYLYASFLINNKLFIRVQNEIMIYDIKKNVVKSLNFNNFSNNKIYHSVINLDNKNVMLIYAYNKYNHKFKNQIISIIENNININCKSNDIFFYFK